MSIPLSTFIPEIYWAAVVQMVLCGPGRNCFPKRLRKKGQAQSNRGCTFTRIDFLVMKSLLVQLMTSQA